MPCAGGVGQSGCTWQAVFPLVPPTAGQHPARMRYHHRGPLPCAERLPARRPVQHASQRLAASRRCARECGAPGIHFRRRDVCPPLPVPRAEIHLEQRGIDPVHPTPAPQPAADRRTTLQRRGVHNLGQCVSARGSLNAPGQPLGPPRIHPQIGDADAAAASALGSRMPPRPDNQRRQRLRVFNQHTTPAAPPLR